MPLKPPPMPEFDVPIASDPSGRLTTVWWDWLQRYFRWSEESAGSGGGGGSDGAVTSVTGTPPVVVTGTALMADVETFAAGDITVSMPAATGSQNGYLTSANWTTFNGKEPAIAAGTTSQWWRGDKSWQTLPAPAWGSITGVPTIFPPDPEAVDDRVATLLVAGANISLTYNDAVGSITIASTASGGGSVAWADITGKPATFPPTLPIAQSGVTNLTTDLAAKAPLASPVFTGNPTAPTPTAGDADTSIATTAFVASAITTAGASYAPASHTHTASQVTDFAEATDDRVAALLTAGANITLTYNDAAGTLAIASTAGGGGIPEAPTDGQIYGRRGSDASWQLTTGGAFLPLTGGTLSGPGNLTVAGTLMSTGLDNVFHDIPGTGSKGIVWSRSGSARWQIYTGSVASGEHFNISRYNDSGTLIDTVFAINRSSGITTANGLTAGTGGLVSGGSISNTGAFTQSGGGISVTYGGGHLISLINGSNNMQVGQGGTIGTYNVSPGTLRHVLQMAGNNYFNFDQGFFFPSITGGPTLGTASFKWNTIYSTVGTINTSDEALKQDIRPLTDAEKRVAQALKGLIVVYRFIDAVETKGEAARIHTGVIAQRVAEAFAAEGLDAHRYGLWCADERYTETFNEETSSYDRTYTGEMMYAIRYEELLAFIIGGL